MFLDFLKRQPCLQKLFFRRPDEAYELFLALTTRTELSGLSFYERIICIANNVTMTDVQHIHDSLSSKVNDFMEITKEHYPDIHEISKEEAIRSTGKAYAAKIFAYFDGFYLVNGVFFYQKLPNSNYWKRMEEPLKTATGRVDPHYAVPIYTGYPENFRFSFCGACGDVNYLQQSNVQFFSEKFYIDSPVPASDSSDVAICL